MSDPELAPDTSQQEEVGNIQTPLVGQITAPATLIHVLPRGFHRIRHYGLLAGSARKDCIAQARELLAVAPAPEEPAGEEPSDQFPPCPCCGGVMIIIETFAPGCRPRAPPAAKPSNRETVHDPA